MTSHSTYHLFKQKIMNKTELIDKIAAKANLTKADSRKMFSFGLLISEPWFSCPQIDRLQPGDWGGYFQYQ